MKHRKLLSFLIFAPLLASCDLFTPPYLLGYAENGYEQTSHFIESREDQLIDTLIMFLDELGSKSVVSARGTNASYNSYTNFVFDYSNEHALNHSLDISIDLNINSINSNIFDNSFKKNLKETLIKTTCSKTSGNVSIFYGSQFDRENSSIYLSDSTFVSDVNLMERYLTIGNDIFTALPNPYDSLYSFTFLNSFLYREKYDQLSNEGRMLLNSSFNVFEAWSQFDYRDIVRKSVANIPWAFDLRNTGFYDTIEINLNAEELNMLCQIFSSTPYSTPFVGGNVNILLNYNDNRLMQVFVEQTLETTFVTSAYDSRVEDYVRVANNKKEYFKCLFDIKY